MTTNEDFSKYGKDFQRGLAALIYKDRVFSERIEEVLDVSFFELKYLRVFVDRVFRYKKKFDVHPTGKVMGSLLRSTLDEEESAVAKLTRDFYAHITADSLVIEGEDYIQETAIDFCRKQCLKKAIIKAIGIVKKESTSFDEVKKVIDKAISLGADNNFGYDFLEDFEDRYDEELRITIPTGWPEIDTILGGGNSGGELSVIIGPTGAGKSYILVSQGAAAIKQGKTVIHYTLELKDTAVARRYDACLTNTDLSDLKQFKEQVKTRIADIPGRLIIKQYPTKTASVQTIRNHLNKMKARGIDPDVIILDYGDLLKVVNSSGAKHDDLGDIFEELRGLGGEFGCPLLTATQTNRGGLDAEIVTLGDIADAYSKCFCADFIFTMSRTAEDKVANTGRMFVAKNRNGPDGLIFPLYMNTGTAQIEVHKQDNRTIAEVGRDSVKDQDKRLKEKYKKHLAKTK